MKDLLLKNSKEIKELVIYTLLLVILIVLMIVIP